MKSRPIIWQRLVTSDGKTCDRCNATHQQIQGAISKLKEALRPLGIEPALEIRDIDEASFKANPSESNRIWIGGRPMEQWLGARVGRSRCCSVCGESECRTVEIGAATFEAIPQTDVMFLSGGGIMAHPGGPPAGVVSIRQAWEAVAAGLPLAEAARFHTELRQALETFGGSSQ